jgi:hypothetical protein
MCTAQQKRETLVKLSQNGRKEEKNQKDGNNKKTILKLSYPFISYHGRFGNRAGRILEYIKIIHSL